MTCRLLSLDETKSRIGQRCTFVQTLCLVTVAAVALSRTTISTHTTFADIGDIGLKAFIDSRAISATNLRVCKDIHRKMRGRTGLESLGRVGPIWSRGELSSSSKSYGSSSSCSFSSAKESAHTWTFCSKQLFPAMYKGGRNGEICRKNALDIKTRTRRQEENPQDLVSKFPAAYFRHTNVSGMWRNSPNGTITSYVPFVRLPLVSLIVL